ncbi:MAG: hypothetical protein WDN10_03750 [bacterium]
MSDGTKYFVWLLASLAAANAFLAYSALRTLPSVLTISFLSVGAGEAILVQSPAGADILIDAGPDASILRALGTELGPFDRTIDAILVTHGSASAIGGLSDVFNDYQVRSFFSSGVNYHSFAEEVLRDALKHEQGLQTVTLARGERIDIGGGAYIDVLYPDRDVSGVDSDTASLVLRIVYGETSFLITGAAPSGVEEYLVRLDGARLKSGVLLAGDSGKKTSTSATFLSAVHPDTVVISVDTGNRFGYPHQETLDRIVTEGAAIARTGDGSVRFVSDGNTVRLESR